MKKSVLSVTIVTLLAGCGSQGDLDVGDETVRVGQALSDYAADWDGYGEAYQVPGDHDDRIRLTLDQNGEGTIRFGEEALFAPASDPNEAFPPTFPLGSGADGYDPGVLTGLRSGFAYAVSGAVVTAARLQFKVELAAVMESWCVLQAPEPVPGWSCGASGWTSGISEAGQYEDCSTGAETNPQPLDCDVAVQCSHCQCDTEECHAVARNSVSVDAALTNDGDMLEGTLLTVDNERVTIRMTR
jgi:hypothetical protein